MTAAELLDAAAPGRERQILRCLLAFAAGDAFGVGYEYLMEPIPVDTEHIAPRADWPLGGVSDDTHLSLLTVGATRAGDPATSAAQFILDLRDAAPTLRGLGPTTRAALGLPPDSGHVVGTPVIGNTNGGMMRTALLGLAFAAGADVPAGDGAIGRDAARREWVAALTRATHGAATAVECAVLASGLYSRALGEVQFDVYAVLAAEAHAIGSALRFDGWTPPAEGISLDPAETLAAVAWVVARSERPADAYRLACEIGGDTDTVAALAGGLVAAVCDEVAFTSIPWIDEVMWDEIPQVVDAAARLAAL